MTLVQLIHASTGWTWVKLQYVNLKALLLSNVLIDHLMNKIHGRGGVEIFKDIYLCGPNGKNLLICLRF